MMNSTLVGIFFINDNKIFIKFYITIKNDDITSQCLFRNYALAMFLIFLNELFYKILCT